MITVNGTNGLEVFGNLADDERLDDSERAAAKRIYDSLKRQSDYDDQYRDVHPNDCPAEPNCRHTNYDFCGYGNENIPFVDGHITFRVFHCTDGVSVNVGIDRHSTKAATEVGFTAKNTRVKKYSTNFRGPFAVLERIDGSPLFETLPTIDDRAVVCYEPNDHDSGLSVVGVSDSRWADADEEKTANFAEWGESLAEIHAKMVDFANAAKPE